MPISPWAKLLLLGAVGSLGLSACGEESGGEPEPLPGRDGGMVKPADGGSDADASIPMDAGHDAGDEPAPDAGFLSECQGDVLSFSAARASGRIFSAAISGNHAHLVYLEPACGGSRARNHAQALVHTDFDTTGEASEPSALVNAAPADCYVTRDPTLLARAAGGFELFFTSNRTGRNELFYLPASQREDPVRQTDNAQTEHASASALFGDDRRLRVAYAKEQAALGGALVSEIVTAAANGPEVPVVAADAGFHVTRLAFAALEHAEEDIAGAIAWVSDSAMRAGLYLRFLDSAGQPVGDLRTLSERPGAVSDVSLASREDGAAVVYTVDPSGSAQELRFRRLDADGTLGNEVRLTYANERVRDISIAAYSSGYAVAYRRLGGVDGNQGSMRLMFVDPEGNVGRTRLVGPANLNGAGAEVLVARDGRLLVLWVDTESVGSAESGSPELENRVRVARVVCP